MHCLGKRAIGQPKRCPSCDHSESEIVQRKYVVSELRKCLRCKLLFRYPLDSLGDNYEFYQDQYKQGFTSECPSEEELTALLRNGFKNHEKDYSAYLSVMQALGIGSGMRVIDYGCSWGYGSWQLQQAGYDVQGYELSLPRAEFGREHLRLPIVDSVGQIRGGADVFFSAHVLEHVPSIQEVVEQAKRWIKPGGWFIGFTPNGSDEFRRRNEAGFRTLWSRVHPNVLTGEFYQQLFPENPVLLASDPYPIDILRQWDRKSRVVLPLSGTELLSAVIL